jgi:hypothetical protein
MKLKSFNFDRLKNSSETRSFVAVFGIAVIVVSLTAFFAFRPQGGSPGTQIAQDTFTIITPPPSSKKDSLQIQTFRLKRNPRPTPSGNLCKGNIFNEEPDIIYATDPAFGGVAVAGGQIRIWVWEDDGFGGSVSQGTKVDPATGRITTVGNRGSDPNGYSWDPAIYLTKLTSPTQAGPYSGDKENGGTAYFPSIIKGVANYEGNRSADINSVPIDPPVNIIKPRSGNDLTFSEFIWEVSSLNLTTGDWRVQIIMHDGDEDLAINCTTIRF